MIERSGFGAEIAEFDAGMKAGGLDKAKEGISDDFLEALTAIGTPDEVRAGVAATATPGHEPVHRPVPRTDFAATLEAAAPADDCRRHCELRLRPNFIADSRPLLP